MAINYSKDWKVLDFTLRLSSLKTATHLASTVSLLTNPCHVPLYLMHQQKYIRSFAHLTVRIHHRFHAVQPKNPFSLVDANLLHEGGKGRNLPFKDLKEGRKTEREVTSKQPVQKF